MLRRAFLLASALALASVVACKEETTRPPPASETSPPGQAGGGSGGRDASASGSDGGSDDGGTCNDLTTADAPAVDQLAVASDPPAGTGGTIESGTYELTDARIYGSAGAGATGLSVRGKLQLEMTGTSGTFARVVATGAQGGTSIEDRESGTLVVSGTSALLTTTCPPSSGQEQYAYTATATTLVMTNVTSRESYTFTKR